MAAIGEHRYQISELDRERVGQGLNKQGKRSRFVELLKLLLDGAADSVHLLREL